MCPTSTERSTGRPAARRLRRARSKYAPTSLTRRAEDNIDAQRAAELAARTSYGRLVAYLAVSWRDVAAAEDALGDALLAALESWPSGHRRGRPHTSDAPDRPRPGRGTYRLGVSGLADDDEPAPRAREGEDPRGRHPLRGSGSEGASGARRGGPGDDLRRIR